MSNVDDGDENTETNDQSVEDENLNDTDSDEDEGTTEDDSDDDAGDSDDSDSDQGDDEGEGDEPDTSARERATTQIDRLKIEKQYYKDLAEGKNPEKPAWIKSKPGNTAPKGPKSKIDEATLARLEVRGVLEPADQEYVVKFARTEKIDIAEALAEDVVKDRLSKNKRIREQRGSSATPNNRVGTGANPKNVDYWIRKGQLPSDPDLADKVQTELAKRARQGR